MRRRRVLAGLGALVPVGASGCAAPPGTTWIASCPDYGTDADRTVCSRTAPRPDLLLDPSAVVYDYEPGPTPTSESIGFALENGTDEAVTFEPGAAAVYGRVDGEWERLEADAGEGEEETLASGEDYEFRVRDSDAPTPSDGDRTVTVPFEDAGDHALVLPVSESGDGDRVAVTCRFYYRD